MPIAQPSGEIDNAMLAEKAPLITSRANGGLGGAVVRGTEGPSAGGTVTGSVAALDGVGDVRARAQDRPEDAANAGDETEDCDERDDRIRAASALAYLGMRRY